MIRRSDRAVRSWVCPIRTGQLLRPALLSGAVLLLIGWQLQFWPYTVDDAFISYRYARNMGSGNGLVYNPGERVEGYSNFLWVVLTALASRCGCEPVVTTKVIGAACGLAALWLVGLLGSDGSAARRWAAPLLLAAQGGLALWSVAGLETSLFLVLLLLSAMLVVRRRKAWVAPAILLLLTRPEGFMYALVLFGARLLTAGGRAARREGVVLVCAAVPYAAWRFSYYGDILPNTYYAKAAASGPELHYVWWYLQKVLAGGLVLLLAIAAFAKRLIRPIYAAITGVNLVSVLSVGGDWMPLFRLLLPATAILLVAACQAGPAFSRGARRLATVALCAIGVWYLGYGSLSALRARDSARGYARAHVPLAMKLRREAPAGSWVALMDIGMIGYYSGLNVLDITGLTDPVIARAGGGMLAKWVDIGYILDRKPLHVVLVSSSDPRTGRFRMANPTDRRLHRNQRFQAAYSFASSFDYYGDSREPGYYLCLFRRAG